MLVPLKGNVTLRDFCSEKLYPYPLQLKLPLANLDFFLPIFQFLPTQDNDQKSKLRPTKSASHCKEFKPLVILYMISWQRLEVKDKTNVQGIV